MFVDIKDVNFRVDNMVAFGTMTIPATMQTPEFYAISVWLREVKEPIVVTYATEDERDMYIETIKDAINHLAKL